MRARGSPRGVLVHSDGGGIYGDEDYLRKLDEHGVKRSMSRKRNPCDNAVIESFFSTLRFELLCRTRFADPDEAEREISEWIERFYNLHRRHTTLGNVSPINYELAWQMRRQRTELTCPRNRGRRSPRLVARSREESILEHGDQHRHAARQATQVDAANQEQTGKCGRNFGECANP